MTQATLTNWLATLPPSGFTGTSTALRQSLAGCLVPGETLPGSRSTVRTLASLLTATKYTLRHRRLTAARLLVIEPQSTPGGAPLSSFPERLANGPSKLVAEADRTTGVESQAEAAA